jgi:hypothetical protein
MNRLLILLFLFVYCCSSAPPQTIPEWEKAVQEHSEAGRTVEKLQAKVELGKLLGAAQKWDRAEKLFKEVQTEFTQAGLVPGSPASDAAAEATFILAENQLAFDDLAPLTGAMREQQRQLQAALERIRTVRPAYMEIMGYKSSKWMVAALYRTGAIYMQVATILRNSPVPSDLPHGEDVLDAYKNAIDEYVERFESEALSTWSKAVEEARKKEVDTDWSQRLEADLRKHSNHSR